MEEPGFVALTVKRSRSRTGTCRHAHNHIDRLTPSPVCFRQIVNDLVKSFSSKIRKLHFHHGFHALDRKTQPRTDNGSFTYGGIADPRLSKFLNKTFSNFKYPAVV